MMKIHWMKFMFAVAVAALFCSTAAAGVIQSSPLPVASGPGLGFANVAAVITVQPNNDNVPSPNFLDNNVVVPLKRFDFADYIDNKPGGVLKIKVSGRRQPFLVELAW